MPSIGRKCQSTGNFALFLQTVVPLPVKCDQQLSFYHNGKLFEHLLVSVSWFKEHHDKQAFGKPLQLWWKDLFHVGVLFVPMQFVVDQCVSACVKYEQTVWLLCPLRTALLLSKFCAH